MAATKRRLSGFSLLEILITIFIVTVGLLGLAGMQVLAQETELESYQRAQAVVLMNDIVDRISANRKGAACYAITTPSSGYPYLGTAGTNKTNSPSTSGECTSVATSNPEARARAVLDLQFIDDLLLGSTEKVATASVGAMVGARACVGFDATRQAYSVAIAWQGLTATFDPKLWPTTTTPETARMCATGLYGTDDARRRVVWTTLILADLST